MSDSVIKAGTSSEYLTSSVKRCLVGILISVGKEIFWDVSKNVQILSESAVTYSLCKRLLPLSACNHFKSDSVNANFSSHFVVRNNELKEWYWKLSCNRVLYNGQFHNNSIYEATGSWNNRTRSLLTGKGRWGIRTSVVSIRGESARKVATGVLTKHIKSSM
jgi:hypothetical protein